MNEWMTRMRTFKMGPDFTIFILFFSAVMFEAYWYREWFMASFFVAIGIMFWRILARQAEH
jgi:hypothetical protein